MAEPRVPGLVQSQEVESEWEDCADWTSAATGILWDPEMAATGGNFCGFVPGPLQSQEAEWEREDCADWTSTATGIYGPGTTGKTGDSAKQFRGCSERTSRRRITVGCLSYDTFGLYRHDSGVFGAGCSGI